MPTPADFELPSINPVPRLKKNGMKSNLPPGPGPGRSKGSINKVTKDLKAGLLTAAEELGIDGKGTGGLVGFLKYTAVNHPKAFCHMLGKLVPMTLNTAGNGGIVAPAVNISIMSVESGHYLSAEDVKRMGYTDVQIEQHPPPPPAEEPIARSPEDARLWAELNSLPMEELARRAGVSPDDVVDQS